MAYIGKSIESGTFSVLDTSGNTYNGSNTTFSLGTQVGSPAQLLVSHDGVIQKAGTDYSLASGGTQITFSTAPASGASIFIVEISGAVGGPLDSDLNGSELILDADGDTSITADTDDQIDFKIAGADDLRMTANAINVLSGTTLTIDSGATITNSGTANGFGTDPDGAQTFNESGASVDFRVESNGDANCLIVDGSGDRVGMGVAVPEAKLHIFTGDASVGPHANADELIIEGSAHTGFSILSGSTSTGNIYFGDSGDDNIGQIEYNHAENQLKFVTNANSRMTIADDGVVAISNRLILDADGNSSYKLNAEFGGNSESGAYMNDKDGANNATYFNFRRQGTEIGSIIRNGTNDAVAYNTSSDYRLKDGIVDKTDGIEKIKQLKPRKFYWKSNSDKTLVDGFLAHEVQSIIPEAISGIKDATETYKDEDGNNQTRIIPQGIDQSKLVPLLTAALQEAITKIETLETEMTALKARVTTLEG